MANRGRHSTQEVEAKIDDHIVMDPFPNLGFVSGLGFISISRIIFNNLLLELNENAPNFGLTLNNSMLLQAENGAELAGGSQVRGLNS